MILGVLQARASSSRLPGKVLRPILGESMLVRQIERISRAKRLDRLLVATSQEPSDDPIAMLCERTGVEVYRGSLPDVLDRYYQAARLHHPAHVVRMTGDCPLIDPEIIDQVISTHLVENNDYTSNTLRRTFPDGLDVEVFRFSLLARTWKEAGPGYDREHVTPYMYRECASGRMGYVMQDNDYSAYRWTVDTAEDFEFVTRVYAELYPTKPEFVSGDVMTLLERHPELMAINAVT